MRFPSAIALFLVSVADPANGFASLQSRRCCGPVLSGIKPLPEKAPFVLQGILDDFESGGGAGAGSEAASSEDDSAFQTLFEDVVFSTNDPRQSVEDRWNEGCGDPEFAAFLQSKLEEADDEDERQAYQDLVNVVGEVKIAKDSEDAEKLAAQASREEEQRKREEEIAQSVEESGPVSRSMSQADVLKAAGEIENGVISASKEAYEEDGPSDFMTDARATVGLGGFSDSGRMRVGGN